MDSLCRILLLLTGLICLALKETYGFLNSESSAANCGQTTFTRSSGTIAFTSSSDGKAERYCTYQIKTRKKTRIVLKWESFKVDGEMPQCSGSAVSVYTGCGSKSSQKLINFCSQNTASLPHNIYTKDNCLNILFKSSSSSNENFRASYSSSDEYEPVSSSSHCPVFGRQTSYTKSGVIYSPQWPAGYSQSLLSNCVWTIKVPSAYLIKLTFMDIDIYKTSSSCLFSNERLRLKYKKSVLINGEGEEDNEYFCGTEDPFTRTTKYYEVELKFTTLGQRRANRGFVVGYIAYKTEESEKMSTVVIVLISIAAVVFVIGSGIFVWRFKKFGEDSHSGERTRLRLPRLPRFFSRN